MSNAYRASVIQRMGSHLCDGRIMVLNGVDHAGEISDESSGKTVHGTGRGAGGGRFWSFKVAIIRLVDFPYIAATITRLIAYRIFITTTYSDRLALNIKPVQLRSASICTINIVITISPGLIIFQASLAQFLEIGFTSAKSHGKGGRKNVTQIHRLLLY